MIRHPLLARQVRRALGSTPRAPELEELLRLVDSAYQETDEARRMLERSLELTSRELLAKRDNLRAFFESAPLAIGICAWEAGEVRFVAHNAHAARLLGAPGSRLTKSGWDSGTIEMWRAGCEAVVHGAPTTRLEFRVDGPPRWLAATLCSTASHDALPRCCYVIEDITERQRDMVELVAQQRLATLGELAAGVAHEMNNPLAYVLSNLTFACEELPHLGAPSAGRELSAEVGRALAEARAGVERITEIARDLKSLGRRADRADHADLGRILAFACNVAELEVKPRARLVRQFGDLPVVHGDDTRLGQVFLNLLLNAAQAIPPGAPHHHEVRVCATTTGDQVLVEISDSGCGMAEEVQARIFEPFFSLRADKGGTGLGLSICRTIVASFGGTVSLVRSTPGVGTTFSVSLSRVDAVAEERPLHVSSLPPRRARLLVVDDEPQIGTAIRRALWAQHEVTLADSGGAALAVLERDSQWDLVLCDLTMPEMDGLGVYQALLDEHPGLAASFALMTGDRTRRQADLALRPTIPVLDKPFDQSTLRAFVRSRLRATP